MATPVTPDFGPSVTVAGRPAEVTVVGEALIDLVSSPDGELAAVHGGAPFNTARALARLGVAVDLRTAIASDRFGAGLLDALIADGVGVAGVTRCAQPTTLALAEIDAGGSADYRFYIDGTSCAVVPDLTPPVAGWLFTGGLALVLEPLADAVEAMITDVAGRVPVMVDINCRPRVIPERDRYTARVRRVVGRADVVKVSDEDLTYLFPDSTAEGAAEALRELGASVVIVTAGADGITVLDDTGIRVEPVPEATVVDTIGAGDTFDAGFLGWFVAHGGWDPGRDELSAALRAGAAAAAVVVGRRGADPPHRGELDPSLWPSTRE